MVLLMLERKNCYSRVELGLRPNVYHLNDFLENGDLEEPTDKLIEVGREMLRLYEEETGENPCGLYLVGGIVREDTSQEGRKDVDFLIESVRQTRPIEESRLYFLLTSSIREIFNENYDVFVGKLEEHEDGTIQSHIDVSGHFF